MTTYIEHSADYLGETVTAELYPTWFFQEFPQDPPRPRGYVGRHRWTVRRHRRTPWGAR